MSQYTIKQDGGDVGNRFSKSYGSRREAQDAYDEAIEDTLQGGHTLSLYAPSGALMCKYEPFYRDENGNIDTL